MLLYYNFKGKLPGEDFEELFTSGALKTQKELINVGAAVKNFENSI